MTSFFIIIVMTLVVFSYAILFLWPVCLMGIIGFQIGKDTFRNWHFPVYFIDFFRYPRLPFILAPFFLDPKGVIMSLFKKGKKLPSEKKMDSKIYQSLFNPVLIPDDKTFRLEPKVQIVIQSTEFGQKKGV
jgi:hypothetical protein